MVACVYCVPGQACAVCGSAPPKPAACEPCKGTGLGACTACKGKGCKAPATCLLPPCDVCQGRGRALPDLPQTASEQWNRTMGGSR